MATANGAAPDLAPPSGATTAVLDQVVATAFSTDSSHAMIQMRDPEGKVFVLVMAAEKLVTLQHLASQMRQRLNRRNLPVDNIVMQFPRQFMVGHSDQQRGVCAITFDHELPSEAIYVLTDEAALGLAKGLEQDVLSRMSPAERHEHDRKNHPLLLPIQPKIFRP